MHQDVCTNDTHRCYKLKKHQYNNQFLRAPVSFLRRKSLIFFISQHWCGIYYALIFFAFNASIILVMYVSWCFYICSALVLVIPLSVPQRKTSTRTSNHPYFFSCDEALLKPLLKHTLSQMEILVFIFLEIFANFIKLKISLITFARRYFPCSGTQSSQIFRLCALKFLLGSQVRDDVSR